MAIFLSRAILLSSAALLAAVSMGSLQPKEAVSLDSAEAVSIIGATAQITDQASGLQFIARVDTGAKLTSLHCAESDLVIEQGSTEPEQNIGKPARLRIHNRQGEFVWIDTRIDSYIEIRNADHAEYRYCVQLRLEHNGVAQQVLVTLNDRSSMTYALLIGRNFLEGAYVVDVADEGPGEPRIARK